MTEAQALLAGLVAGVLVCTLVGGLVWLAGRYTANALLGWTALLLSAGLEWALVETTAEERDEDEAALGALLARSDLSPAERRTLDRRRSEAEARRRFFFAVRRWQNEEEWRREVQKSES
jgi:hypothetical protein